MTVWLTCVLVTGIVVCVIVIVFAFFKMMFSMKNDNDDGKLEAMRERQGQQNNLLLANFIVPFL